MLVSAIQQSDSIIHIYIYIYIYIHIHTHTYTHTHTHTHSGEGNVPTHSSIFAWRIPRTEEPGQLQSMGSQRIRHTEWLTHTHSLSLFLRYYSHIGHYRILTRVLCAISRFLLVISSVYISVCICQSQLPNLSPLLFPSHYITKSLFSISVMQLLFCN